VQLILENRVLQLLALPLRFDQGGTFEPKSVIGLVGLAELVVQIMNKVSDGRQDFEAVTLRRAVGIARFG
jgi:hypothetical protein